jgi:chemotaxis protein MotB
MASPSQGGNQSVIIIKKRKKGGHDGHHGGAWKVAYADFVTAMMAFFLLLWLLNVTTSEQRKGIADYFSPASVARSTSGSGGVLGGLTITVPGAMVSAGSPMAVETPVQSRPGEQATRPNPSDDEDDYDQAGKSKERPTEKELEDALAQREAQKFAEAERMLFETIGGIPELAHLAKNLVIDQTPEGLRIQIVDEANHTMFPLGSAQMFQQTRLLLEQVAKVVGQLPNRLSISGHTDATPFANGGTAYGNWELSSDRANASRRALVQAGIPEGRISTVVGRADRDHLVPDQPNSPRNRRIGIVLLRERSPSPVAAEAGRPPAPAAGPVAGTPATGGPATGNAPAANPAAGDPAAPPRPAPSPRS